jgi:hypothetical protein
MSRFNGILLINGGQSSLSGDLLLKADIADPSQAISAATAFVTGKGFQNGFSAVVIGTKGQVNSVQGIVMSDIQSPQAATQQGSRLLGEFVRKPRGISRPVAPAKKQRRPRRKKKLQKIKKQAKAASARRPASRKSKKTSR